MKTIKKTSATKHFLKISVLVCGLLALVACSDGDTQPSEESSSAVSEQASIENPSEQKVEAVAQDAGVEIAEVSEAQLKLGKRAYIRCQACHTLGAGEEHRVGPNLNGLFTATAGEKEGFEYSGALKDSQIKWNDETLREWLRSPSTFLPGNKMAFGGVPSDREMDALMAYLRTESK